MTDPVDAVAAQLHATYCCIRWQIRGNTYTAQIINPALYPPTDDHAALDRLRAQHFMQGLANLHGFNLTRAYDAYGNLPPLTTTGVPSCGWCLAKGHPCPVHRESTTFYGPGNPQCPAQDPNGLDCAGPVGHPDGGDHANVNGTWPIGNDAHTEPS